MTKIRSRKTRQVDLRIWWCPQVPCKAFYADVTSIDEARRLLATLARYDAFQLENNIKPDYANAGGLQVYEDGEWVEWCDDDGNDVDGRMS